MPRAERPVCITISFYMTNREFLIFMIHNIMQLVQTNRQTLIHIVSVTGVEWHNKTSHSSTATWFNLFSWLFGYSKWPFWLALLLWSRGGDVTSYIFIFICNDRSRNYVSSSVTFQIMPVPPIGPRIVLMSQHFTHCVRVLCWNQWRHFHSSQKRKSISHVIGLRLRYLSKAIPITGPGDP
jgi:hypothetical protein